MTNNMTIAVDLGKDVTYELMIEQHGGYDNAKKAYNDMREAINQVPSKHSLENKSQVLKAALLAYRRAHNIFEVGDYILPNSKLLSFEPYLLTEDCKIEYKYTTKSGHWGYVLKPYLPKAWRHATDEEIKANRRLDQEPKWGRAVQLEKLKQTIVVTTTPSGESPFYQAFPEAEHKGGAMVEITWDEGRDITAELITDIEHHQ